MNIVSSNQGLLVFDRCGNGQVQVVFVPPDDGSEDDRRIILYFDPRALVPWFKEVLKQYTTLQRK